MTTPIIPPATTPRNIALIIEYRTTGSRAYTHIIGQGVIKIVVQDGTERTPKSVHADRAFDWLQKHGYISISHAWMGPAARYRRRRHVFRLPVGESA